MAAGGTWTAQTKKRPGAYINFVGTPKSLAGVGARGTLATPLPLPWGAEIVELTAQDLVTGASLEKAGVLFSDAEALNLRLALQSCQKAVVYRTNAATAAKATGQIAEGELKATAKFGGTLGNEIRVTMAVDMSADTLIIKTFVKDLLKDQLKLPAQATLEAISDKMELSNDYIDMELQAFKSGGTVTLAGGTNGDELKDFGAAFTAFEQYQFNILALTQTDETTKKQAIQWVQGLREDQGVKVQVVLADYSSDYEGVISTSNQRYRITDGTEISGVQAVLAIGSLEAGASITESLTGAVVPDAVAVLDAPTKHEDIEKALDAGKLVLSRRDDGAIVIEKDQNALHSFTPTKGYIFSKNRPLRTLDQINNDIKTLFNKSYLGKVSNNENGRNIFKGDLAQYMKQLESMEAIQNFSIDDITILPGNDVDAVVVTLYVQPVDSMEKLYMTVNVVS